MAKKTIENKPILELTFEEKKSRIHSLPLMPLCFFDIGLLGLYYKNNFYR